MNLRTLFWLSVITGCLMAPIAQGQSVTLDGFYDSSNAFEVAAYSNTELVNWTNGHNTTDDYWYDGAGASTIQATIRYGSGTLAGDTSTPGRTYYFLYVEAPLAIKGMSWSKDSSDLADYDKYVLGGAYLHDEVGKTGTPHIKKMDYGKATDSEKVEFGGYTGEFSEDGLISGDTDGGGPGVKGLADSIDYLLANPHLLQNENGDPFDYKETGGSDELKNSTSVNPDIAMAFEFQLETQTALDNAVDAAKTGIVLHLSPSKIPEPSSTLLLGLGSIGMLLRRKR
jgi:hypothetical protein